jgi:acetyltransferase-like isoleucine patch superfamily enzyme
MIRLLYRILHLPYRVLKYLRYKQKFGSFYWSSYIGNPLRIDGGKNIFIGENVSIKYRTWIASTPLTGDKSQLVFEDGCVIGHFNHIYATKSIILHKNVLTADKVYISDNLHGYEDVETPIKDQPVVQNGEVEIGEGSWLGENVCVVGAKIGKHCVIGANSVVTKDIPDYSVAVGSPARVIKKYDFNENKWKKTDGGGG